MLGRGGGRGGRWVDFSGQIWAQRHTIHKQNQTQTKSNMNMNDSFPDCIRDGGLQVTLRTDELAPRPKHDADAGLLHDM